MYSVARESSASKVAASGKYKVKDLKDPSNAYYFPKLEKFLEKTYEHESLAKACYSRAIDISAPYAKMVTKKTIDSRCAIACVAVDEHDEIVATSSALELVISRESDRNPDDIRPVQFIKELDSLVRKNLELESKYDPFVADVKKCIEEDQQEPDSMKHRVLEGGRTASSVKGGLLICSLWMAQQFALRPNLRYIAGRGNDDIVAATITNSATYRRIASLEYRNSCVAIKRDGETGDEARFKFIATPARKIPEGMPPGYVRGSHFSVFLLPTAKESRL